MNKETRFTVIGAGHGGKAMAADLAVRGFAVNLYNRSAERINEIALRGEIELEYEDGTHHLGRLSVVTSDMAEALDGSDAIMVVLPASGHRDVARLCAPHLRDGQIVVLHPGRTGGALEFRQILDRMGCNADVTVAEAGTFIFASRSTGPSQARIFRRKNAVPLAALPALRTGHVLETVCEAYPQFIPAPNVLHTSLDNMGAMFHPALTLLNAGWIERTKGEFQFYVDGVTRSTARVLGVLDRERVTIAAALGVRARSALQWLKDAYSTKGDTLYEAIQSNPGYQGIKAPRNLRHRYIFEDVPFSLVPLASLGQQFGVDTWAVDAMVRLACVAHGTNYYERGRTVEDMGLKGLRVGEVRRYVQEGKVNPVYTFAKGGNGKSRRLPALAVKSPQPRGDQQRASKIKE
ncbi:MAG: NAD/NADP octopine/nopaline dehydrogenase family protein [Anaerolineae bacterium]|jgi:opine dehydrogenase